MRRRLRTLARRRQFWSGSRAWRWMRGRLCRLGPGLQRIRNGGVQPQFWVVDRGPAGRRLKRDSYANHAQATRSTSCRQPDVFGIAPPRITPRREIFAPNHPISAEINRFQIRNVCLPGCSEKIINLQRFLRSLAFLYAVARAHHSAALKGPVDHPLATLSGALPRFVRRRWLPSEIPPQQGTSQSSRA